MLLEARNMALFFRTPRFLWQPKEPEAKEHIPGQTFLQNWTKNTQITCLHRKPTPTASPWNDRLFGPALEAANFSASRSQTCPAKHTQTRLTRRAKCTSRNPERMKLAFKLTTRSIRFPLFHRALRDKGRLRVTQWIGGCQAEMMDRGYENAGRECVLKHPVNCRINR